MDHLLQDTDLLESLMDFRDATRQSPDERDTIIARADLILQNTIKTWGDSVITFGEKVDFNRGMGQSGKYGFHYWIWARPLRVEPIYDLYNRREKCEAHFFRGGHTFPQEARAKAFALLDRWLKEDTN